MKILFLNPIGELGGAERCLLDFFGELRRLKPAWELHLISGTPGPLLAQAEALGVHTEMLPMPDALAAAGEAPPLRSSLPFAAILTNAPRLSRAWFAARRYADQLRRRVVELEPDVLHSNGIKCHLLTRMMKLKALPVIWHVHDFLSSRNLIRRGLGWAAPAATLALACSDAAATDARSVLGSVPVQSLLNAVDTTRYEPGPGDGASLDALAGMPTAAEGTLRIGLVATFARWKGQDLFIKAAALLKGDALPVPLRYYIVGGPIYKTQNSQFTLDELRAASSEWGLSESLGFIPFQDETEAIYRALDVVVHASTKPEPFGRTIAEAMACGRPVIASREGGVTELIDDGRTALAFAPRDAFALAKAISRMASDPILRATLSAKARKTALARFSLPRMGASLARTIEGVAKLSDRR